MEILKLEQRLEGAIGGRGKFLGYKPKNAKGEEKKDAKYEHTAIVTGKQKTRRKR